MIFCLLDIHQILQLQSVCVCVNVEMDSPVFVVPIIVIGTDPFTDPQHIVLEAVLECERIDVVLLYVLIVALLLFQQFLANGLRRERQVLGDDLEKREHLAILAVARHLNNDATCFDGCDVMMDRSLATSHSMTLTFSGYGLPRIIYPPPGKHTGVINLPVNLETDHF